MDTANATNGDDRPSTLQDPDTTPSKDPTTPALPQENTDWEQVYNERFSRKFIFSTYTREPLFNFLRKPTTKVYRLQEDLDFCRNLCNPRYRYLGQEPLTKTLAARTRHELRDGYRRCLIDAGLRVWLREAWSYGWSLIVRVPYLSGDVDFPPPSEIKNGYILPARVRAHILGQTDEVPVDKDPILRPRLRAMAAMLCLPHNSQIPYEDDLLSRGPWLNQTTAVYFEPHFGDSGLDFIARALFAAWREVDEARGETPNLQQMRYLANPVMLVGEPSRKPITDAIATHLRICGAVADAQDKPVSPKDPYSWVEHGAEMGVVYQSVIIVFDKKPDRLRGENEAESRNIWLEQYSVLIVRTGKEEHLSEPIDFSELGPAILPLDRDELLHGKQQVVRVSLLTAVRFVMDLEHRERERSPRLTAMKKVLDRETFREANAFATDALAVAKRFGSMNSEWHTFEAVRRAQAYFDGEPFYANAKLTELNKENRSLHRWL